MLWICIAYFIAAQAMGKYEMTDNPGNWPIPYMRLRYNVGAMIANLIWTPVALLARLL